jgi:hypothetical protein
MQCGKTVCLHILGALCKCSLDRIHRYIFIMVILIRALKVMVEGELHWESS